MNMNYKQEKNFVKLGRSWGIIIPPWFFKVLNINPSDDKIELTLDENKIVINKSEKN